MAVKTIATFLLTILTCIAGCYGYSLHNKLSAGFYLSNNPPAANTLGVYAQPNAQVEEMRMFNREGVEQAPQRDTS